MTTRDARIDSIRVCAGHDGPTVVGRATLRAAGSCRSLRWPGPRGSSAPACDDAIGLEPAAMKSSSAHPRKAARRRCGTGRSCRPCCPSTSPSDRFVARTCDKRRRSPRRRFPSNAVELALAVAAPAAHGAVGSNAAIVIAANGNRHEAIVGGTAFTLVVRAPTPTADHRCEGPQLW
jgi:hypothetical protein